MRRRDIWTPHDGHLSFCPANSQLYRFEVKLGRIFHASRSWQTAGDRLIDGPRPEDGTDFSSYAAGASSDIARSDCRDEVVAGHTDRIGARADRSLGQAAMRVLCAIP